MTRFAFNIFIRRLEVMNKTLNGDINVFLSHFMLFLGENIIFAKIKIFLAFFVGPGS